MKNVIFVNENQECFSFLVFQSQFWASAKYIVVTQQSKDEGGSSSEES